MTVKEIVRQYLEDNGYDGLHNEKEWCCCAFINFMQCDWVPDNFSCVPAIATKNDDGFIVYRPITNKEQV